MTHLAFHLADYAATADIDRLPQEVIDKAKACILYGLAVAIAGVHANQPAQAAAVIQTGGAGEATCFLTASRAEAADAAFANGVLAHARVQDDAHPAGHVGVVVLPAAIATAERVGARGVDLITAVIMGYETALRIGRDHAADLSTRGFRTTPAYGVFGAAAAAARLMHLPARAQGHALALAANMASGLREFAEAGSEDFAFQAGVAARNGLLAAKLAAVGATGAATALEGPAGFFRAYGNAPGSYAERLVADLGESFEILDVTYKPYPVCQFHRAFITGCIDLRARAAGAAPSTLTIHMHPFEADFYGVRFAGPFETFPQTFMSAPYCAALAWARGCVRLDGLTDFAALDILELVPCVHIVADPQRPRYAPRIVATFDATLPLEWEEVRDAGTYHLNWTTACEMAANLCAEVGAVDHTQPLVDAVHDLDRAVDIGRLTDTVRLACQRACKHSTTPKYVAQKGSQDP